MVKIVLTGGCGFIGHHFAEYIHKNTDWDIIIFDKLTYASMGFKRLRNNELINSPRVKIYTMDICNDISEGIKKEIGNDIDYIVHMAAETHVDNSIKEPKNVIINNIHSTINLLEWARTLSNLKIFFNFSTDEVYGSALNDILYKEWDRHRPSNPYSASKSAAENICVSYENTYKIPLMTVNVMNAYGERQHVEKFIPLCIKKILNDELVYIHSYPDAIKSGSRFYIHAQSIASAVLFLIQNGKVGEKYNITGEKEVSNLELAQLISKYVGKELKFKMVNFVNDRPGHDLRYGLDGSKMRELGWSPKDDFETSLEKTVKWTLENREWLEEI
jgi:dTDP-glucose 4,6-dehydratase